MGNEDKDNVNKKLQTYIETLKRFREHRETFEFYYYVNGYIDSSWEKQTDEPFYKGKFDRCEDFSYDDLERLNWFLTELRAGNEQLINLLKLGGIHVSL